MNMKTVKQAVDQYLVVEQELKDALSMRGTKLERISLAESQVSAAAQELTDARRNMMLGIGGDDDLNRVINAEARLKATKFMLSEREHAAEDELPANRLRGTRERLHECRRIILAAVVEEELAKIPPEVIASLVKCHALSLQAGVVGEGAWFERRFFDTVKPKVFSAITREVLISLGVDKVKRVAKRGEAA